MITNNYAPYITDSWKASRTLTITLGLRWEYISPVDVKDGLIIQPRADNGDAICAIVGRYVASGSTQPVV